MPSPRVNRRLAIGIFLTAIMGVVLYQPFASFVGIAIPCLTPISVDGNTPVTIPCGKGVAAPADTGGGGLFVGGIGQLGPLMGNTIAGVVAGGGASSDPCGGQSPGGAEATGAGGAFGTLVGPGPLMGNNAGVVAGNFPRTPTPDLQQTATPLQLTAGQLTPLQFTTQTAVPELVDGGGIGIFVAPGPIMGTNAGVAAGDVAGQVSGGGASSNPCPSSASAGSQSSQSSCNFSCGNKCYKVSADCTQCIPVTPAPAGCTTTGNIGGPGQGNGLGGGLPGGGAGGLPGGGVGGGVQGGGVGGKAGGAGGVPGGAAGTAGGVGAAGGHAGTFGTNGGGFEGPIGGNGGIIGGTGGSSGGSSRSSTSSSSTSSSSSSSSSSSQSSGASQSSIIGGPPPPPGGSSASSQSSVSSVSSSSTSSSNSSSTSSTQTFNGSCDACKSCGPKGFCSAQRCSQFGYLCQFNENSGLCEPLPPPFCPGSSSSSSVTSGSSSTASSVSSFSSSSSYSSYSSSSVITYYSSSFSSVPGCTGVECGAGGTPFCGAQEPPKDCVLDFSKAPSCFRCDDRSSSSSSSENFFSSIPFTDIGGVNGIAAGGVMGGPMGGLGPAPAPAAGTFGGLGGPATLPPQYPPPPDLRFCGNGRLDAGEYCDAGRDNSDVLPDHCRTNCTPPHCGDRIVDTGLGEQCDDGSLNNTTASLCSAMCTFVSPSAPENLAMTIDLPLLPGQISTVPTSNTTASITPISIMHPPVGQTGPAALAAMAAGAAAGWSWLRRRKLKMSA